MNLLFLTGQQGQSIVLNVDLIQALKMEPCVDHTRLETSYTDEGWADHLVTETPAAIRAQLERMVHPLVAVEPVPAVPLMDPKTGRRMDFPVHADAAKTIPFVCPKCGGKTDERPGYATCVACQTISLFCSDEQRWRAVATA